MSRIRTIFVVSTAALAAAGCASTKLEEKPAPHNPLGAKGAGEGGVIPVGGVIANAVAAALRPLRVCPRELPLSPPRVWTLIHETKKT